MWCRWCRCMICIFWAYSCKLWGRVLKNQGPPGNNPDYVCMIWGCFQVDLDSSKFSLYPHWFVRVIDRRSHTIVARCSPKRSSGRSKTQAEWPWPASWYRPEDLFPGGAMPNPRQIVRRYRSIPIRSGVPVAHGKDSSLRSEWHCRTCHPERSEGSSTF